MLTPSTLLTRPAVLAASRVRAWSRRSQQGARRNAMMAATAAAQRRAQRQEVEDYLARRAGRTPMYDAAGSPEARAGEQPEHLTGGRTGEA